jgi:hypothetical protein
MVKRALQEEEKNRAGIIHVVRVFPVVTAAFGSFRIPVVSDFRSFQLSFRSGLSPAVPVIADKRN